MTGCAIYETKFGYIKIEYVDECVTFLKKVCEMPVNFGKSTDYTDMVIGQVNEYFEGKRKRFDFNYILTGTEFQKRVWAALCDIPYGEIRSYKEIAIAIGNEKASRAVGLANNKNPISIAVPCHRVIGSSGKLVGYAGGLDMKKKLLDLERNNK